MQGDNAETSSGANEIGKWGRVIRENDIRTDG
jgi:hypothetical protein